MKYVLVSTFLFVVGLFGFLNPLRAGISIFFAPIQFGLSKMAFNTKEALNFFTDANKVRNENLYLRQQVITLESSLVDLKQIKAENELLKQQLKVTDVSFKEADLLLAELMGNASDPSENTLIVNKGTKDGVRKDDNVVYGNYLIGIIKSAGFNISIVELLTSPSLAFTVMDIDSATKTAALARGGHGNSIMLDRILPTEKVKIDDIVVTSGKDGYFVPNLIIGKITDITDDPSQPLKRASAKLLINISTINKVFIVKKGYK